jgi:hypothetical protein
VIDADRASLRSLRLLLVLPAVSFDRYFEAAIDELVARGHHVRVAVESGRKQALPDGAGLVLSRLVAEDSVSIDKLPPVPNRLRERVARALRASIDYLRYLDSEYAAAGALRARAASRVPGPMRAVLTSRLLRGTGGRRLVARSLRAVEARLPVPSWAAAPIGAHGLDAVLVTPVVGLGSHQVDYLRAAARAGVPTIFPVASWDNLTNKGVLKHAPTATLVWNELQADEATRLHGLPPERVVVTGAHTFDHWFEWQPGTSPDEFRALTGLPAGRPFVLYVCSSEFVAPGEVGFVREWVEQLRASDRPQLAGLGVLVRPHPQNAGVWVGEAFEAEGAAVWPRGGAVPTDASRKRGYFDSLFHCSAVVGINTSALVEAAIVGRPTLAPIDPRFEHAQEGTLHFGHLDAGLGEGAVITGRTWNEHLDQLARTLETSSKALPRLEAFVRHFVRPHGLDRRAASLFADAVERAATEATRVESEGS